MALTEKQITSIAEAYWSRIGYALLRISENDSKTPDFTLARDKQEFLAELKSPGLLLDDATNLYKFKTSHSKLLNFIRKARKQFVSHDPKHERPRILVFASSDMQLNWRTLTDAMQVGSTIKTCVKQNPSPSAQAAT